MSKWSQEHPIAVDVFNGESYVSTYHSTAEGAADRTVVLAKRYSVLPEDMRPSDRAYVTEIGHRVLTVTLTDTESAIREQVITYVGDPSKPLAAPVVDKFG
jgi:hypothetical protein